MNCRNCGKEMVIGNREIEIAPGVKQMHRIAMCRTCGYEIDLDKIPKKKNNTSTIILTIIIALGIFCFIANHFSSDTATTNESAESEKNTTESNNTITYNDGISFDVSNLNVTLDKLELNYTGYEEYSKPDDGMKYIKINVSYENTSNDSQYVSIYDFDCYADGELMQQSYLSGGTNDDFINANISSGRKVSFDIYYSVPKIANAIELEYKQPVLLGNDKTTTIILK